VKALSIRQPWASLIVSGEKLVENRTWRTEFRGWFAIHASKSRAENYPIDERRLPFGAVIGLAYLKDCLPIDEVDDPYADGPWCFCLGKVIELDPIPFKGRLGFFDLPADVVKRFNRVVRQGS